jgi:acyl carrier protein
MDHEAIERRIRQVMAGVFAVEEEHINTETSISSLEGWDSLHHVSLMMALEQEFGLQIDIDDAVEMTTYPVVCEKLGGYLKGR